MKRIIYFIFFTNICFSQLSAQIDKLLKIKAELENKVSVGSSTDEVKKILGKPKAIEGGFPKSNEIILFSELPEQVGQINNSTWFYILPVRKIIYDAPEDAICYINEIIVKLDIYNEYMYEDSVYFYEGKPISIAMAKSYKLLRDRKLEIVVKKEDETSIKLLKAHKETKAIIPVLCIIFDRGTQVVASSKVYFKLVN